MTQLAPDARDALEAARPHFEGTALAALEEADVRLSLGAASLRDRPATRALGWLSEVADQPPAFSLAAAALGAGLLAGRPRLAEGAARALLSLWVATQVKGAVKSRVDRTRPNKALEEGRYESGPGRHDEGPWNSFPSGHTADAVAAARAVARVAPELARPLTALALGVGAIQVPRGTHHVLDVAAGAAVGALAEAAVHAAWEQLRPSGPRRAGP